jgi:hypothetical protein
MNRILLASLLAIAPLASTASDSAPAYIVETRTVNAKMLIRISEPLPNKPNCASSNNWDLVTTDETLMAAINAAQKHEPLVYITGDGSCSGNVENLRDVTVGNIDV